MNKPKILIAAEIFPPTIGGPASWLERVVPELLKLGYRIKIVTFGEEKDIKDLGVKIKCISLQQNKWIRWYKYINALSKEAKNFDIILALGNVLAGLAAIKAKQKYQIPVILRVPGDFAWEKGQAHGIGPVGLEYFYKNKFSFYIEWLKKMQLRVAQKVDRLVVNSDYQARNIKKYWNVTDGKIEIIRNFFKIEGFTDLDHGQVRQKLGWEKKTIITVGRLVELKGNKELINNITNWLNQNQDWQIVMIGDGPQKKELELFVKKENLTKQIKFTGQVRPPELFKYYQAADAYILYSLHEGSPNTILEAIYFNLPIIASKRGGTTELLEQYPAGLLVEWGKKEDLIVALDKLKNSRRDSERVREARKQILKQYDLENNLNKWVKTINQILEK